MRVDLWWSYAIFCHSWSRTVLTATWSIASLLNALLTRNGTRMPRFAPGGSLVHAGLGETPFSSSPKASIDLDMMKVASQLVAGHHEVHKHYHSNSEQTLMYYRILWWRDDSPGGGVYEVGFKLRISGDDCGQEAGGCLLSRA